MLFRSSSPSVPSPRRLRAGGGGLLAALVLLLVAAGLGGPLSASAQTPLWTRPYTPNQLTVQGLRPFLDAPGPARDFFPTGALFVAGSVSLTDRLELVADLPVGHYRIETPNGSDVQSTALGNPYVGVGYASFRVPVFFELGVRLPVADPDTALAPARAADLERRYAFAPEQLTIEAAANVRLPVTERFNVRLRGGGFVLNDPATRDVGVRYALQGWYEGRLFIIGAGLTGRLNVTGAADFPERNAHDLGTAVFVDLRYVQPGAFFGIPLTPATRDGVDVVAGVTLAVPVGDLLRPGR
jgi:hypothetical protein